MWFFYSFFRKVYDFFFIRFSWFRRITTSLRTEDEEDMLLTEEDLKHFSDWLMSDSDDVQKYKIAAKNNDADAQTTLGTWYLEGINVKQNEKKGIQWLEKAAELSHKVALFNLGACYEL